MNHNSFWRYWTAICYECIASRRWAQKTSVNDIMRNIMISLSRRSLVASEEHTHWMWVPAAGYTSTYLYLSISSSFDDGTVNWQLPTWDLCNRNHHIVYSLFIILITCRVREIVSPEKIIIVFVVHICSHFGSAAAWSEATSPQRQNGKLN